MSDLANALLSGMIVELDKFEAKSWCNRWTTD